MLAVAAFVAFWVVVALGLFYLAVRGAPGARPSRDPGRRGSRMSISLFVVTAVVFGVGLPLLMLTGNHSNASAQVSGIKLTAGEKAGRELFGEHCGVCHTLGAANAAGKVGPDLGTLKPAVSLLLHTIANGCLPNAPATSQEICLGQGVMPAGVVAGIQAQQVADFVARVTGASTAAAISASSAGAAASSSSTTSSTSSAPAATSPSSPPSSGKGSTLQLAASKTGMLMFDTKSLTAKAGKVTIDFTNESPLGHNVTVQSGTSGPTIAATPTFTGGTKSITMTLKAGTYTYYCSVPGHRQAGMLGTLTVTPSSAAAASPPPAPSGAATTLKLSASKTGMLMFDTKSLTAKAGKVTIDFTNESPLPHNVTVQSGTSGSTIAATPTFTGGTKSITMTLKAGTYTYYCSVPGHRQAGMLGTLTVK